MRLDKGNERRKEDTYEHGPYGNERDRLPRASMRHVEDLASVSSEDIEAGFVHSLWIDSIICSGNIDDVSNGGIDWSVESMIICWCQSISQNVSP